MKCGPNIGRSQQGPDHPAPPGRASVAAAVLAALVAQMATPAFAQPAAGAEGATAARDTSGQAAAGPAPAQATPPLTREERHWADLVRACSANAKHVRLHLPGRAVETDHVETEAAGVRFRAPHLPVRSAAITEAPAGTDTLVAWSDVSKVEVRNVASTGEGAATGAVVGLAIGLPVALAVAVAAAMGSLFTFKQQDSHAGGILLGAAALGLLAGATVSRRPNGGWVTCCERDTSALAQDAATLP